MQRSSYSAPGIQPSMSPDRRPRLCPIVQACSTRPACESDFFHAHRAPFLLSLAATALLRSLEISPALGVGDRGTPSSGGVLLGGSTLALLAVIDATWPAASPLAYVALMALGSYVLDLPGGVVLAVVGTIIHGLAAPRYEGASAAPMLAAYLMLGVAGTVSGRAARRLRDRVDHVERLADLSRRLTGDLDPAAVLRRGVEAGVALTAADGGCVATLDRMRWCAATVFTQGAWEPVPPTPDTGQNGTPHDEEPLLAAVGARAQLAVPVPDSDCALVVFRHDPRPFDPPCRTALEHLACEVARGLRVANLHGAAVQAERDKASRLAHVAHELRAPLHVISGTVELLGNHVDELGHACVERLARQTRLLVGMTSDLLELCRLERTEPAVRRERVDVVELCEQVLELALPLVGNRSLRLAARVEPGAEWVTTDPEKLRHILTNLAINAVKYTPGGLVELRAARRDGSMTFGVHDTGVGIPLAEQERIFEPFYRGAADDGSSASGVGLGLALAQYLARLLGTCIQVDSRPGEGATFFLVLSENLPSAQVTSHARS